MHCSKRLGERVIVRTFRSEFTELHVCMTLLNRFQHDRIHNLLCPRLPLRHSA